MLGTYNVAVVRQPSEEQRERWQDQGDLIRRARETRGMTQAALAEALHLSPKTLIQIEKGRKPLDQWEMDVLMRELGLGPNAFYDPPMRGQTVEAPIEPYLVQYGDEAAAEGGALDRRRRDRRKRPRRPPSQP